MGIAKPTDAQISTAIYVLTCLCNGHSGGLDCPTCLHWRDDTRTCTLVNIVTAMEAMGAKEATKGNAEDVFGAQKGDAQKAL